jgi:Ca2+-transporting ATPase
MNLKKQPITHQTLKIEQPLTTSPWHTLQATKAAAMLEAGEISLKTGLNQTEATRRLVQYGFNELTDRGAKSPLKILWEQLTAVMVLILLAAALLSLFLARFLEAGAILAIVLLFTLLGFVQEYRAEKAIAALKKLAVPNVRVWRDGLLKEVPARELVPGDLISLEAGNVVPADLRIVESVNLRIQEAALTGESEPVEKVSEALPEPQLLLGDRRNMGYMGTIVTYGRGTALVVATGMQTELGKIADLIQVVRPEATPLQQKLDRVGKQLALAGVLVAIVIVVLGLIAGEDLAEMVLTGVSVAVAVIPEGLPAVVTITLALGAQKMLRRNALVRKLPAVETLGSVTTICSDKTGTLTQNQMTVTVVEVAGECFDLTSASLPALKGPTPTEPVEIAGKQVEICPKSTTSALALLLAAGALCNDACLLLEKGTAGSCSLGDPTEIALLVAASKSGFDQSQLHKLMPRVGELPFDSSRKRMTTVHQRPPGVLSETILAAWGTKGLNPQLPYIALTKGAVDGLLGLSRYVWDSGLVKPLDMEERQRILLCNNRLASKGMRVLGIAFRPVKHAQLTGEDQTELIFIGLVGMIDPPRPEAKLAVQKCKCAGIRPIMITGDHPLTAGYVAKELDISQEARVITGAELDRLEEAEFEEVVEQVSVFARVVPEHKLRIVQALQKKGQIVAMTGDGINDAPALKQANIGVAMGITGTDVSKEAADVVLRDDNFATIVGAVEEGRIIYDNLRRFVLFSVAGNIGKVAIMLLWPLPFALLGLPLVASVALLPLQLLWLNLMTDGLLGLSIAAHKYVPRLTSGP